jgi:hypothetical protein
MATPNLFILGAGKCGTTSLYFMLGKHHDVHVSAVKEPSFFCSYFQITQNPIDYFRLFYSDKRYRVDSSHVYFSNPETAPVLYDLFPAAKFILILRSPEQRAYSLYRHMRRFIHPDGKPYEPIESFEEALEQEPLRAADPDFHRTCRQYYWNYMYCGSSKYDVQLQRYFNLFDRDQFHILSLAELNRDPAGSARDIASFLQIDAAPLLESAADIYNQDGEHQDFSANSAAHMRREFEGLTARVDGLIGRELDWSM